MKGIVFIGFILIFPFHHGGSQINDSLDFQGQISGWLNVNPGNELPLWVGARYIPQLNYQLSDTRGQMLDFELSANLSQSNGIYPFNRLEAEGNIKPYRLWTRYSNNQLELRLGLQKINFGSASMLRPLMWFDQVDPRDPLQLTDGVWGLLGRYYFLNNANIWLWGLYGNDGPKTWEIGRTTAKKPEYGGRVQIPVPRGETALSFHHRNSDLRDFGFTYEGAENVPENRFGFDSKVDVGIGIWAEAVWIHKSADAGVFTNQQLFNVGADYTFGIGNGLHLSYEQLLFSYDQKAFEFQNKNFFSGVSLSYPVGIMDNISAMMYYDWTQHALYNFINWQRQLNRLTLYLMAFWNPESFHLPQQGESGQLFAGKGIQVMVVYHY